MWYVFAKFDEDGWEKWNLGESMGLGMDTKQEAQVELAKSVFNYPGIQFRVRFVRGKPKWQLTEI